MSTRCQIEFYDEPIGNSIDAKPAARIYKHCDGYPKGILPMLKQLEEILLQPIGMHGFRLDHPEWAAAEFVFQFRSCSNESVPKSETVVSDDFTVAYSIQRKSIGQIYVTQELHVDIEYLYRVYTVGKKTKKWKIDIYSPRFEPYPGSKLIALTKVKGKR